MRYSVPNSISEVSPCKGYLFTQPRHNSMITLRSLNFVKHGVKKKLGKYYRVLMTEIHRHGSMQRIPGPLCVFK